MDGDPGDPCRTPGLEDPPEGGGGHAVAPVPVPGFAPENALEARLATDPVLLEGLAWGRPRRGHPEGTVGAHVGDLLATVDAWDVRGRERAELRFMTLVHDALKGRVKEWLPRTGENHHAMRARRFAERYTADESLLATIELHDRPYSIWKRLRRTGEDQSERLDAMRARLPDPDLFLRFVELDSSTKGKDPEPLKWLREELAARRGSA